jgi:hypothetical protein
VNPSEVHLAYDPTRAEGPSPYSTAGSSNAPYPYSPHASGPAYDSNPFLDSGLPYQNPNPSLPYQPSSPYTDTPNQYQHPPPPGAYHQYQQHPLTYPPQPVTQHHTRTISADPFQGAPSIQGSDFDPYAADAMELSPPSSMSSPPTSQPSQPSSQRESMSVGQRKAAMAGTSAYQPSRFIVHTDADDDLPPPNNDGVVELPPQYSERGTGMPVAGPSGKGPRP